MGREQAIARRQRLLASKEGSARDEWTIYIFVYLTCTKLRTNQLHHPLSMSIHMLLGVVDCCSQRRSEGRYSMHVSRIQIIGISQALPQRLSAFLFCGEAPGFCKCSCLATAKIIESIYPSQDRLRKHPGSTPGNFIGRTPTDLPGQRREPFPWSTTCYHFWPWPTKPKKYRAS